MLKEWAKREVEIACKREAPDREEGEWDYGCACYESALKAYNSLLEDGHSGMSWGMTVSILNKLCKGIPLTPITEEDFNNVKHVVEDSPKWLAERGLKSNIQCPRMSSLFREEHLDGTITYSDVDRLICYNSNSDIGFYSGLASKIIDEMFPITLPYSGTPTPYEVIMEEFLVDPKNGDFDTVGVLYIRTPDGTQVTVNRYFDVSNGRREISLEEYSQRLDQAGLLEYKEK